MASGDKTRYKVQETNNDQFLIFKKLNLEFGIWNLFISCILYLNEYNASGQSGARNNPTPLGKLYQAVTRKVLLFDQKASGTSQPVKCWIIAKIDVRRPERISG